MRLALSGLLLLASVVARGEGRPADYALVLADEPVARRLRSRAELGTAAAHRARVRTAQESLRGELARRGIPVTGAVELLLNAVFVAAPPERVPELRALPGVLRVARLAPLKRHLDRALDLAGAPAAWSALGGAAGAGAGVKIGILDTGIEQTHAGFRDASLEMPPGFPKGDAAFTNTKVIVARSYTAQLPYFSDSKYYGDPAWSQPDDTTPRDRDGHGTAAAMIVAGVANTGPLAAIQGVAPKAWLGNYKIFGTPGVNYGSNQGVIIRALDQAWQDGMDIALVAVGTQPDYAPLQVLPECGGPCDVYAQAVENATQTGMVVVASAGNDGNSGLAVPTLSTIHTPGTAPAAITVGASTNAHVHYASVTAGDALYDALAGDGPKLAAPLSAPLRDVAGLAADGLACAALPAGSLDGAIALIGRGTCTFSDKINHAQMAGAVAVILCQAAGEETPIADLGAQDTGIPAMMVGATSGLALKSAASVTMDPVLRAVEITAGEVADFSSRGPAIGTYGIKPELVAPGRNLYTAAETLDPGGAVWSAGGYASVAGSSFAAAMVAGAAALVKQAHPDFTPAQIKSALVNTAAAGVLEGGTAARVTSAGAGRLNAGDAVAVAATLEPATLSFGRITTRGSVDASLSLRVANVSSAAITLTFAVRQRDADANAAVAVAPASLTLAVGARDSVVVRLRGTGPNPGAYEGFIDVTGAGPALHVPYLYLVGDGVPYDMVTVWGGFTTFTGDPEPFTLLFRLIDRYGVEVANYPVGFGVAAGGGRIVAADTQTYPYGVAGFQARVGAAAGDQTFTATAGPLTLLFYGYARPRQVVTTVVDTASQQGGPFAPGSFISILGSNLAPATLAALTFELPLSLATVSVSFDAPGISLPGRLNFVSPGRIDVQIPAEFAGQPQVMLKVNIGGVIGSLVTVPLGG